MITLKQAEKRLQEKGFPIRYPTLYQWAKNGIIIDNQTPWIVASQIGNRWFISEESLEIIYDAISRGRRIQLRTKEKTSTVETRGRKKGTKFGKYKCGGQSLHSHRVLYS